MFENTLELAENKLLLLFILSEIKLPISNNQLTEIVLENNFINYFTFQQYLSDLHSAELIDYIEAEGKERITVSKKGLNVLSLFQNRISKEKLSVIHTYLSEKKIKIKNEITISADYTIEKKDNFIVSLKATEDEVILIDLKVNVPTKKQATNLCSKWKANSSILYNEIIQLLLKD